MNEKDRCQMRRDDGVRIRSHNGDSNEFELSLIQLLPRAEQQYEVFNSVSFKSSIA
jgi:hypothetical protein